MISRLTAMVVTMKRMANSNEPFLTRFKIKNITNGARLGAPFVFYISLPRRND